MINRFYDISEGELTLYGKNPKSTSEDELRSLIGLVPQKNILFTGTIRENIRWGKPDADDEDEEPRRRHGFWLLVTTAIATSLDAMAVGVGLAFLQVNIIATALAIGCATLIMSTLGMMVGRFIGSIIGKKAEILGGLVLIGIGVQILWTHFHG